MESETPNESRRTVLKSLGAVTGIATAGIGGSTATASADHDGNGSQSFEDIVATEGFNQTVSPGSSVQSAVDQIPYINPGHEFIIDLEEGKHSGTINVGPCMQGGTGGRPIQIVGDPENPEDYVVESICVHGVGGCNGITIEGVTFSETSDQISSGAACWLYDSSATIDSCRFEPSDGEPFDAGIEAYHGTDAKITNTDVSNCQHGIKAKRMSDIWSKDATGSAEDYAYWATETSKIGYWHDESSPSGGEGVAREDNASTVRMRNGDPPESVS